MTGSSDDFDAMWGDDADWDESADAPVGDGNAHLEGSELLQAAAREFIAAARTMLDAAEDVIADPKAIGAVFGSLANVTNDLIRSAAQSNPMTRWRSGEPGPDAARGQEPDDGVEHIIID